MMDLHTFMEGRKVLEDYDADFVMSVGTMPLCDPGQWYWGKEEAFIERVPLIGLHTIMMPVPQHTVCDINTEEDWKRAEGMYARLYPDHVVGL
jgi:CMP-N-acetylneuraminic acid synthetase